MPDFGPPVAAGSHALSGDLSKRAAIHAVSHLLRDVRRKSWAKRVALAGEALGPMLADGDVSAFVATLQGPLVPKALQKRLAAWADDGDAIAFITAIRGQDVARRTQQLADQRSGNYADPLAGIAVDVGDMGSILTGCGAIVRATADWIRETTGDPLWDARGYKIKEPLHAVVDALRATDGDVYEAAWPVAEAANAVGAITTPAPWHEPAFRWILTELACVAGEGGAPRPPIFWTRRPPNAASDPFGNVEDPVPNALEELESLRTADPKRAVRRLEVVVDLLGKLRGRDPRVNGMPATRQFVLERLAEATGKSHFQLYDLMQWNKLSKDADVLAALDG